MNNWRNYNSIIIPSTPPHVEIDTKTIDEKFFSKNAFLARWTSNFDCKKQTSFWYVVCDEKVNYFKYSRNTRSKISRANRYFDVRRIQKEILIEQGFRVFKKAQKRYKFILFDKTRKTYLQEIQDLDNKWEIWGVFLKGGKTLAAYSINKISDNVCDYSSTKFDPAYLKKYSSYLLYHTMNKYYLNIQKLDYVHNGTRNLSHQTNIQEFLIQKFFFRKAYCKINVLYSKRVELLIKILYPYYLIFNKIPLNIFRKFAVVLNQERINQLVTKQLQSNFNNSLLVLSNGNFKSGSTWITAIVKELLSDEGTVFPKGFQNPKHKNWIHRYKINRFLNTNDFYSKRFWISKCHITEKSIIEKISKTNRIRIINIDRDIKDVLVSHYFHLQNSGKINYDFKTYYNKWGRYKAIQVQNYSNSWQNISCLKLNYEDLKLDKNNSILKIAKYLEIGDVDVNKIIKETDLINLRQKSKLKDLNEEKWFFRKGEIGDWKNYFDEKMLEDLNQIQGGKLSSYSRFIFFIKFTFRLKLKYFLYRYFPRLYLIFDENF